jgi:hypothetical protein
VNSQSGTQVLVGPPGRERLEGSPKGAVGGGQLRSQVEFVRLGLIRQSLPNRQRGPGILERAADRPGELMHLEPFEQGVSQLPLQGVVCAMPREQLLSPFDGQGRGITGCIQVARLAQHCCPARGLGDIITLVVAIQRVGLMQVLAGVQSRTRMRDGGGIVTAPGLHRTETGQGAHAGVLQAHIERPLRQQFVAQHQ